MPTIKQIVYKKPKPPSFITIEAEYLSEDRDFVYLVCGKYLKKNIISTKIMHIKVPERADTEATDDA